MANAQSTVVELINAHSDNLTRAERQLADVIFANYPISGLGSITELAAAADVSTPTVARMVQKIGFAGYGEFQSALRAELEDVVSNPISKRDTWVENAPDQHILNRFPQQAAENIRRTLESVDAVDFDDACELVADTKRRVYVAGGRITHALANYLFMHLQMIRPDTQLVWANSNAWPHYLLDLQPADVVIVFDVRRYENSTLLLAELAKEREAEILLFTDQWRSPVDRVASKTFAARIAVPSAWDSTLALMLLVEALIASVQELTWEDTRDRTEALEDMFNRTKLFRKFV